MLDHNHTMRKLLKDALIAGRVAVRPEGRVPGLVDEALMRFAGMPPIAGGSTSVYDFQNGVVLAVSIVSATYNASGNGTGVNLQNTEVQGFMVVVTGTITDGTHVITLEESKNDNTADEQGLADPYAAMPNGPSITLDTAAADDNSAQIANFVRTEKFVRAIRTVTPGATGGVYGVLVGGQKKRTGI